MKRIISLYIVLFSLLFVVSCVSKKKYIKLQEEVAQYKVADTFQDAALTTEKYEKSGIELTLNREVIEKDNQIDSLEAVIANLERSLMKCEEGR